MEGRSGADKFYAVSLLAMAMFYAGAAGANPAHEQLMRMSDSDRNIALTRYLKASGQKCDLVTRNFFQGRAKKETHFGTSNAEMGRRMLSRLRMTRLAQRM